MKNKLLLLMAVLSAIFALCGTTCFAKTYGGEFDGATKDPNNNPYICEWIFDEESKTLYIEGTGKLPDMTAATLPWADYKSKIVNLVIDEGITLLGKRGFIGSTALKNVEFPDTLTYIKMRCFEGCSSLESITLPGHITKIEDQAFLDCTSLKTVVFESGISQLGCYMFGNCTSLEDVYVYGTNTIISRIRANESDGVWFRGCDFDKLTAHCYEGSDADDYFKNDIYTITNWSSVLETGEETEQDFEKKPNSMVSGGYTLNVEYITE